MYYPDKQKKQREQLIQEYEQKNSETDISLIFR